MLLEYLESSTIYGLSFIAKEARLGKVFWGVLIFAAFVTSGILIHNARIDWQKNPVGTSLEAKSISHVPFPRINVCPPKVAFSFLNKCCIVEGTASIL